MCDCGYFEFKLLAYFQLFLRGRGPSQTPKFLFPASPTLLGWWRFKTQYHLVRVLKAKIFRKPVGVGAMP